jgi:hypothetical protein
MTEFTSWATRCEELLESGLPAQDILWYLGDAVDHIPDEQYPLPEGFRADYLNHDVLINRLVVKDGRFVVPEGTEWKVLWVPDERFMLPATRAALDRLSAAGGTVVYGGKDSLLRALSGIRKDVATEPSMGDGPNEDFMWIHRRDGAIDRYFVASGTNGYRGKVTFRAKGNAAIIDPVSGERVAWRNGGELQMPPSRSYFVEFGSAEPVVSKPDMQEMPCRFAAWRLSFKPGWGAPDSVKLDSLVSWTEIAGFSSEAKAYCGTVAYETEFEVKGGNGRFVLDLGRVESVAKVIVNGREVQTLWCAPYSCDITDCLKPGRNLLRVEVTNTWRNRVVYDLGQPESQRKTWILYRKNFSPPPGSPMVPAGLIGPVRLLVSNDGARTFSTK